MTDAEPSTPSFSAPSPGGTHAGSGVAETQDDILDPTYAVVAARAAHLKGATDILVLQVGDVLAITDHFVIASASNPRLVRTVAHDIEEAVARAGGPRPARVEGLAESEWVLADYGAFVVHVFHDDARQYYELERLWSDVPVVPWEDAAASASSSVQRSTGRA